MGNTNSSRAAAAPTTSIPEARAVPVTRVAAAPILMEQKIAEQEDQIRNQATELARLHNANMQLQAANDRLSSEMKRFSLILMVIFFSTTAVVYKYFTNGVFTLDYNFKMNNQAEYLSASPQSTDTIKSAPSLNNSTDEMIFVYSMLTLFTSAFNIALLLYGVGIGISFFGFVAILTILDQEQQYVLKFIVSVIFQFIFDMVGASVIKEHEVQGSFIFLCSIIAVFTSFHEGCQIILEHFILTRVKSRQQRQAAAARENNSSGSLNINARDMDWGIFIEYMGIIILDNVATSRFQAMADVKRKKYLQDGVYNLWMSSLATCCACLYYYHYYNAFSLYILLAYISMFITYVMVLILVSTFINRRSIVKWRVVIGSFGVLALALHLIMEYCQMMPTVFACISYLFLPYFLVYPRIYPSISLRETFNLSTASSILELMVLSIIFVTLSLMLQTYMFIVPHFLIMLPAIVIQYMYYILFERKRERQISNSVSEIQELTKAEKISDAFTISMFCYLTLVLGLNELYRRTFQFQNDKYLIALLNWTGKTAAIQVILKVITRCFIGGFVCLGYWIILFKSLPRSFERRYIGWFLGLIVATFAKYETSSNHSVNMIVYMYDCLAFLCLSTSAIQEDSPDGVFSVYFGLNFDTNLDLIYNCYYGLRIASIIPNLLGVSFSCVYIIPSIFSFYFHGENFSRNFRMNDARIVKPILNRILGVCISCLVMVVAIQVQSKILALVCCFGIYMFIGSVCLSCSASNAVRFAVISMCGFATVLTAQKMDKDFSMLSETVLNSTPYYLQCLFTLFFGSVSTSGKTSPWDLQIVEWFIKI